MMISKNLVLFIFAISCLARANMEKAPPSFAYSDGKAVFIDIEKTTYDFSIDVAQASGNVVSRLEFTTVEEGYPVFDSVNTVNAAKLDGLAVIVRGVTMPFSNPAMVVNKKISSGKHILELTTAMDASASAPEFVSSSVRYAFNMTDLSDRGFLERFVPANLQYDQFEAMVTMSIIGTDVTHMMVSNGDIQELGKNKWSIQFPSYFNSSMHWLHVGPAERYKAVTFDFASVDGRNIPVTLYSVNGNYLLNAQDIAKDSLKMLEEKLGRFPHDKVIIYVTGGSRGGMEYAGATASELGSIWHELAHSYYARGIMPADGDAGWIDEAMASWATDNFSNSPTPPSESSTMGRHSVYNRVTDTDAYSLGKQFMKYLGFLFSEKNLAITDFLKNQVASRKFTVITNEIFESDLEQAYGSSLKSLFNKYIFGVTNLDQAEKHSEQGRNWFRDLEHHRDYTNRDM